jgi:hypothetical protein
MKNEIILYQPNELAEQIEVRLEDETVWLTQAQMALLFGQTKQNISLHIHNCFKENELEKMATVKDSLTVQMEGQRKVNRKLEYYNLDVIISVGYRVKSKQGTLFRIWATRILKDYLLKGYVLNNRMNRLEDNFDALKNKVDQISLQINTQNIPTQGIFFDGQIFDAYVFVTELIKKAKTCVMLIDNYVDEKVLTILSKRANSANAIIYTKTISKQLQLDLSKHNSQFPSIDIKTLANCHDRFLIIDQKELYHLGASLKDLGKKWFAFSKMDESIVRLILEQINMEDAV